MAQVSTGVRSLLSFSTVYDAFEALVGAKRSRREIASKYLRLGGGERVLDIGCGTAGIYEFLPPIEYVGFDPNEKYIEAARKRFGDGLTLRCETVAESSFPPGERFDLAMAIGVVHHLDDDEARRVFEMSHELLEPGGRLVTVDPCFSEDQGRMSRFLVSRDRGQNVRTLDGYMELAASLFGDINAEIRNDLIHIPYTHAILECTKG